MQQLASRRLLDAARLLQVFLGVPCHVCLQNLSGTSGPRLLQSTLSPCYAVGSIPVFHLQ